MKKQILLSILISFLIVGTTGAILFHIAGQQAGRLVKPGSIPSVLADGVYEGGYYAFGKIPAAKVRFTVSDSALSNFYTIDVLTVPRYNLKVKIQQAVADKGLQFDAISGATISSSFVKAAMINAIDKRKSATAASGNDS